MKKQIILTSLFLILILNLNFISAGLCLGNDGYYHGCDDNRYFNDWDRDYDDYYYQHGKYYPTRDYYYRDYYKPRCYKKRCLKDEGLHYKDVEEYKRTIEYEYKDVWGSETIKTSINEKTEIELDYDGPYMYQSHYMGGWDYKDGGGDAEKEGGGDILLNVPWHYSEFKRYIR